MLRQLNAETLLQLVRLGDFCGVSMQAGQAHAVDELILADQEEKSVCV